MRVSACALLVLLALLTGCGRQPELVNVTGTVTLNGSVPPGPGSVFLAPIEDHSGSGVRPAIANFDTDGTFTVCAFGDVPGMKPGRYRVTIQIWKERPQGYFKPGVNLVPAGYRFDDLVVERGKDRMEVSYDVMTKGKAQ